MNEIGQLNERKQEMRRLQAAIEEGRASGVSKRGISDLIAGGLQSLGPQRLSVPNDWHRGHRDDFSLGNERGVYALFLKPDAHLSGIQEKADRLLYVGKAEGVGGLLGRCHFDGKTRNHSPRKSLAVLLKDELDLAVVPGTKESGHDWGLDSASERKLSDWMRANLELAIELSDDPSARETELIEALDPPLNLAGCVATEAKRHLKRLRDKARREALELGRQLPARR